MKNYSCNSKYCNQRWRTRVVTVAY